MKPTDVLKQEHLMIKTMLQVINKVNSQLETKKEVNTEHLQQIVQFIRTFADKCHHSKEEDLLYPVMEEFGIPREGGPIGVMLAEHDTGREYVRNMADAADKIVQGDKTVTKKYVTNALNYANLLSQHIDKEDNILYMMADMHIPEKEQQQLLIKFEKVEVEKIGPGVHDQMHEILHALEKTYL